MSRPRSDERDQLVRNAMNLFWRQGYDATSMADLVAETGLSRSSIYAEFGGKAELFSACADYYIGRVQGPALKAMQGAPKGIAAIRRYFDHHLAHAARDGLPGRGCLMANSMTELGPHEPKVLAKIQAHNQNLYDAFYTALGDEVGLVPQLETLAQHMTISTLGLWSYSRSTDELHILQDYVDTLLSMISSQLRQLTRI